MSVFVAMWPTPSWLGCSPDYCWRVHELWVVVNHGFVLTSEHDLFPAVLMDFAQKGVVLLAAESVAHTKFFGQPGFRDAVAIKFTIHEEIKGAVVPFDYF
jgi:hypothetical protein